MVTKNKPHSSLLMISAKALLCVSLVVSGVCARAAEVSDQAEPGSISDPLGDAYKTPKKPTAGLGRLTVYRVAKGRREGVASVKVNEHFHVALQRGGYSELCAKRLTANLTAEYVEVGEPQADITDSAASPVEIRAGQERYIRVSEIGGGHFELASVSADAAKKELKNTKRQMHTVTRVPGAVECDQPQYQAAPVVAAAPVAVAAANQSQTITLAADALFGFGKSGVQDIPEAGRQSLDQLIRRLQSQYGNFAKTNITVIGHADPIGNPNQNQTLSAARAEAVRTYMVQSGIPAEKIQSKGLGDTKPLISSCGKAAVKENIVCNKPNRRVVVDVGVITGQ